MVRCFPSPFSLTILTECRRGCPQLLDLSLPACTLGCRKGCACYQATTSPHHDPETVRCAPFLGIFCRSNASRAGNLVYSNPERCAWCLGAQIPDARRSSRRLQTSVETTPRFLATSVMLVLTHMIWLSTTKEKSSITKKVRTADTWPVFERII